MFRVFRVWTSEMLGRDLARILRPLVTFAEQIFFFIMVFETDRYWPDNVQYSLIKIGDRKEFPVIVNFRFLPQCSFSFTERLKFYVSLIFLSMQVDGASYRDRQQKSTGS
jgi:hypothetical protein